MPPGSVSTFQKREKPLVLAEIQVADHPARSLVATIRRRPENIPR